MVKGIWPALLLLTAAAPARGYTVASPFSAACHEEITGAALRQVRAELATAPPIPPSVNERALIDDLPFDIDSDLRDLGAAALLLAVRDNDLKGNSPTDTFDIVPISSDPALQREHCLRAPDQDEPGGSEAALADCRAFIHQRAAEALDGLDAAGVPDPARQIHLRVYLSLRGSQTDAVLPLFYVRIAQALHALEDGFTHNFRTADGLRVTAVFNWAEYAGERLLEARDGPAHAHLLDVCDDPDAPRALRHALAREATAALLRAVLDPALGHDEKLARVDEVTARYLTLDTACAAAADYCDPAEQGLRDSGSFGCRVAGRARPTTLWGAGLLIAALLLRRRAGALLVAALLIAQAARADQPAAPPPQAPPADQPAAPPPQAPRADQPAVPPSTVSSDAPATAQGREPGRDVQTPTVGHIEKVRQVKRLGPRVGFYVAVAGAFDRPAMAATLAARVRITERWLVGLDTEWNPWLTSVPQVRAGALNVFFTGIRRWPLMWERVNLRNTLQFGTSILLFDVYGAPRGSVGIYFATSPLGLDIDLGRAWRLVIDPVTFVLPVPHLTAEPFYYLQYRTSIGFQFGG